MARQTLLMFRPRRAWLLCPLVVLTLFFAACGWRNWHLSLDQDSVWLRSALYATRQVPDGVVWAIDMSPQDARFIEREVKKIRPISKIKIVPIKLAEMPFAGEAAKFGCAWIEVEKPSFQFHNRFHATSQIVFGNPPSNATRGDYHTNVLTFTRSPLKFWDNEWHIASVDQHPH